MDQILRQMDAHRWEIRVSKQHDISSKKSLDDVRDLSDFCEAWPELREHVQLHIQSDAIEEAELRATLTWLCHLSDRICAQASDFGI